MNLLQSFIYGIISGLAEFLPISSQGHQAMLKKIFGVTAQEPFRDLLIHISLLLAVAVCLGTYIQRLRREMKIHGRTSKRVSKHMDKRTAYDLRLIRTAVTPMLIVLLLKLATGKLSDNLSLTALFFLINGLIVYIPEHLPQSNKDARQMSAFDSFLVGLCAGLSAFPGVSRVGASLSCCIARGADREKALQWVYILSIPAFVMLMILDIIQIISGGMGLSSFAYFGSCLLSAVGAFGSACIGIFLMRFIAVRSGFSAFGYYCWGAALLSFILYLMV